MNPLIRIIPPFLVRLFARPYVAGDSLAKAIDVAAALLERRGVLTTLDLLAEGIETAELVEQNVATYLAMVEAVAGDPRFADPVLRPTLSLKLSSYTTEPLERGGKALGARAAAARICAAARARGVRVTIDMESAAWTDFTLACFRELAGAGDDVGCVLQTRLHRTEADLDALPPRSRIRLVIGIYQEPEAIALRDKPAMKSRLLAYAERLLTRGHYVEFATHDEAVVRRFVDEVVPRVGATPDRFEVQMLYGVPRDNLIGELTARGIRTRLYVPFANGWDMAIQYLRRRLDEYPAMMWMVAKNLLRRA